MNVARSVDKAKTFFKKITILFHQNVFISLHKYLSSKCNAKKKKKNYIVMESSESIDHLLGQMNRFGKN